MRSHLHQGFDTGGERLEPLPRLLVALRTEPVGGPADEVGGESGKLFLQPERWGAADLEMMHLEDAFAFLDAGLDGLPGVVVGKPGRQIRGHPIRTEVQQHAVTQGLTRIEALQSDIDRVRTPFQLLVGPRDHLGVVTHVRPGGGRAGAPEQSRPDLLVVRTAVDFVAQFNQQGDVVPGRKTGVQAKNGLHRRNVTGILAFKAPQPGLELGYLRLSADAFELLTLDQLAGAHEFPQVSLVAAAPVPSAAAGFGQSAIGLLSPAAGLEVGC